MKQRKVVVIEQRRLMCGPFQFTNKGDDPDVWAVHGRTTMTTADIHQLAASNKYKTPEVVWAKTNLVR